MPTYRTRPIVSVLACAVAAIAVAAGPQASGSHPGRVTIEPSKRVAALVGKMTLDEKLAMVSSKPDPATLGEAGYVPGVPRLGIPELRLADGPAGVRVNAPSTAMPAPIAMASAFDPALAAEYGRTMGRDGRALGVDVLLAPMTNIIRVPQAGRNFETLSEDPYLSSRLVAAEIRGIQDEGLIATVKHFAENNQETNRETVDVTVDEQTMQEVELPAFQAAVRAGVGSVMCSYNSVNGAHACGSRALLNGILKTQLAFRGWVMSDWGATHATTDLVAGLDQNMFTNPGLPSPYFEKPLKDAIKRGDIPMSALDDAVARILGQMEEFGLLDGAATDRPTRDPEEAAAAAQRVAEQGAVLLKNDDALPLGADDTSLALIGAKVKTPKVGGGGSSSVTPASAASPWDTIRARAAGADVQYALGPDTTRVAVPLENSPFDENGDATLTPGGPQLQYGGTLAVPDTGDYTFTLDAPGSFGTATIDGKPVVRATYGSTSASVTLTAGPHKISLFGYPVQGVPETMSFRWVTPAAAAAAREHAVEVAASVDTPIVFVHDDGIEGVDRSSLSLPFGQDGLVAAVAAANPNTIVVLNTGSSITMPWLDDVRAVLDMYYPGQNGAEATARLLFGDVNPSGKLTQTFPASDAQTPVAGDPESYPGVGGEQTYKEGLFVGYRWYDEHQVTPLFPFGYGLSYTSFAYSDLTLERLPQGRVQVRATVTNTGDSAGAEAAQVYAGPSPELAMPQVGRKLVGFAKVQLAPGESRQVTVVVPRRQLSSWNAKRNRWVLGTGPRSFFVGGSSADLPLDGSLTVEAPR